MAIDPDRQARLLMAEHLHKEHNMKVRKIAQELELSEEDVQLVIDGMTDKSKRPRKIKRVPLKDRPPRSDPNETMIEEIKPLPKHTKLGILDHEEYFKKARRLKSDGIPLKKKPEERRTGWFPKEEADVDAQRPPQNKEKINSSPWPQTLQKNNSSKERPRPK